MRTRINDWETPICEPIERSKPKYRVDWFLLGFWLLYLTAFGGCFYIFCRFIQWAVKHPERILAALGLA